MADLKLLVLLGCAVLLDAPACAQPPLEIDPVERKQAMIELALEHRGAAALYETLRERAGGGQRLSWNALPDWSGIWSRSGGIGFEPGVPQGQLPSAKLTPEYHQGLLDKIQARREGREFDVLSLCVPPGYPRWYTEPFLREFVVTPDQTWLMNEVANETRRVYTDGRRHLAPEDLYPTYDGDSIGFWNDDRLIIHTNQLHSGQYTRAYPDYSDQVETVEIWQKVDERTIHADIWVYDPPALIEPWYVTATFSKLSNPDDRLRIHYWHCLENQNNEVFETDEGATDFTDFTFTETDDP